MKVAIMQPYFMPYIGYFKLINYVDTFILLDDVNFIKKGWINRNQIMVNNSSFLFTIPILGGASQNKKINELFISEEINWRANLIKTISLAYCKTPQYELFSPLLYKIIMNGEQHLSSYIYSSLVNMCEYMKIKSNIIKSSSIYCNNHLKGEERIIDICRKVKASEYINLPSGVSLYSNKKFMDYSISLKFMETTKITYNQMNQSFIPNLSIVDYLMFNDPGKFK